MEALSHVGRALVKPVIILVELIVVPQNYVQNHLKFNIDSLIVIQKKVICL